MIQIQRDVVGFLFEIYPKIDTKIIDLYNLFEYVKQKGGFSVLNDAYNSNQQTQSIILEEITSKFEITPNNIQQLLDIYVKHLLALEHYQKDGIISFNIINQIKKFTLNEQKLELTETPHFSFNSMSIPQRLDENISVHSDPVRNELYRNVVIGAIPIIIPENFGIQEQTGKVDPPQELFIQAIQAETQLNTLLNYSINYPYAFLQSGKLQSILQNIINSSYTPQQLLLIADPLFFLIPCCEILNCKILNFEIKTILNIYYENLPDEPQLTFSLIRLLSSFIQRNNFQNISILSDLIKVYSPLIEGFLIFFVHLDDPTSSDLFTFNAAILVLRIYLIEDSDDRISYLLVFLAQILHNLTSENLKLALKTVLKVLYELDESQVYDAVYVFLRGIEGSLE
ncbi:ARID/BRIGHT DNA binding domain-containing protein [Spironucleus salmonicida]|nr:ARID/BRIGHT DNA binding domain-containing protein [Spironucleus salmonicida]